MIILFQPHFGMRRALIWCQKHTLCEEGAAAAARIWPPWHTRWWCATFSLIFTHFFNAAEIMIIAGCIAPNDFLSCIDAIYGRYFRCSMRDLMTGWELEADGFYSDDDLIVARQLLFACLLTSRDIISFIMAIGCYFILWVLLFDDFISGQHDSRYSERRLLCGDDDIWQQVFISQKGIRHLASVDEHWDGAFLYTMSDALFCFRRNTRKIYAEHFAESYSLRCFMRWAMECIWEMSIYMIAYHDNFYELLDVAI